MSHSESPTRKTSPDSWCCKRTPGRPGRGCDRSPVESWTRVALVMSGAPSCACRRTARGAGQLEEDPAAGGVRILAPGDVEGEERDCVDAEAVAPRAAAHPHGRGLELQRLRCAQVNETGRVRFELEH